MKITIKPHKWGMCPTKFKHLNMEVLFSSAGQRGFNSGLHTYMCCKYKLLIKYNNYLFKLLKSILPTDEIAIDILGQMSCGFYTFVWQYCTHFTVDSGNRQRGLTEIYSVENRELFVFFGREVLQLCQDDKQKLHVNPTQ